MMLFNPKDSKAQIKVNYKQSANPMMCTMYKEGEAWQVGLTVSSWTNRMQIKVMRE
jgi:hypothetical protein